jgi:hypothetical protein
MAKIGSNRNTSSNTGTQPSEPIKDERKETRKADGATRDKAAFETEDYKYDWDIYTDKVGDQRGSVGAGLKKEGNELYGKIAFNEKTGRQGLTVSNEYSVNENVSLRGEIGGDNKGKIAGGVGARLENELGYIDAEVKANAKSKLKGMTLAGRYDVSDRTTVKARYSDTNKRKATGYFGVSHNFENAGRADIEAGRSTTRGRYAKVKYTGDDRGRLNAELSDKKGAKLNFSGTQETKTHTFSEDIGYNSGSLDANVYVANKENGNADDFHLSTHGQGDKKEIDANWNATRAYGSTRTFYRRSKEGHHAVGADSKHHITETARALVGGEIDTTGYAKIYSGSEHDLNKNITLGNTLGIDTRGDLHFSHWANVKSDDQSASAGLRLDHSTDGSRNVEGTFSKRTDGGREHDVAVRIDGNTTDGVTRKEIEYNLERPDGLSSGIVLGEDGDNSYGRVSVTNKDDDGDRHTFAMGYSEEEGMEAAGKVTHTISDDVEISAGVRKSRYGGSTVSVGVGAELGEDKDIDMNIGLAANTKNESISAKAGVRRRASEDKLGLGGNIGFSTDKKKNRFNIGGDISTKNLFGIDQLGGKLGLSTDIQTTKKVAVKPSRGELGRLREEALEDAPQGAGFVRYGMKATSKADVGVKVPVGAAFVDAGYKKGKKYQVEFVKLEGHPEIGDAAKKDELEIPGTAKDLLKMKAGESVTISGENTQGFSGGGGIGTNLGAIGPVGFGATVGLNASYALKGKTKTQVTRGGDSSARIVIKADDSKSKAKGIDLSVGFDADLPLDKVGPAGEVVNDVINTVLNNWLGFGAKKGTETITGDERIFDARVDLDKAETHAAYEKAMKGDYSELEALAGKDESAVKIEKSILSDINEKVMPTTLRGLGISLEKETRERLKSSDVSSKSGDFEVKSDLDTQSRDKDGWVKDNSFSVRDYTRHIEAKEGSKLGRYKAEEHYLEINTGNTDAFTSKEELQERLSLASYLLGDDNKELNKFSKKVGKLKEHRKMWVGPRNELRGTKVNTSVVLCDGALDALSNVEESKIWEAMAKAEKHFNPDKPTPDWTDPSKRMAMDAGLSTQNSGVFHGSQLMSAAKNSFGKFRYNEKRELVKKLVYIGSLPDEEKRNDMLRETLAEHPGDNTLIGTLADIVGRDKLDVKLKVDSDAGRGGKTYDLSLRAKGDNFKLQKTVFGADL